MTAGAVLAPTGDGAVLLSVRLSPRGGRDALEGVATDAACRAVLRARVAAPPADGAANTALLRLLADALGLPRGALTLDRGATQRIKRVRIAADPALVQARLTAHLARAT